MASEVKHFLRLLPLMLLVSIGNDLPITALLNPYGINAGGATGVTSVLSQWTSIPFNVVYGIINLPILILGIRCLDLRFSVYSVFVTIVTTLLFPHLAIFLVHTNPLFAAGIGALIYGVAIGTTYRYGFSLGGFALLAKVIEVMTKKQVGTIFTLINFVPVVLALCVNHSYQSFAWSIVFIVLTGMVINATSMGKSYVQHCKVQVGKTFSLPVRMFTVAKEIGKAS